MICMQCGKKTDHVRMVRDFFSVCDECYKTAEVDPKWKESETN